MGKAEYLLGQGRLKQAWQYGWAAYLMEEGSVGSAPRWCATLDRVVLGTPRFAVAVVSRGVPIRARGAGVAPANNPLARLGAALPELAAPLGSALQELGQSPASVPWAGYLGAGADPLRAVQLAQRQDVDVLLVVLLSASRRVGRLDVALQLQLYEPQAKKRRVWQSRSVTRSQYRKLLARGRDLIEEMLDDLRQQIERRYQLSRQPLPAQGVESYARQVVGSRVPDVEKLAVLKYLVDQRVLDEPAARSLAQNLWTEQKSFLEPSEELKQWLEKNLPPVR